MTGFVYAIESGDAVKIGWAKNPIRRLSELNVGSPGTHRLLGFVEASRAQEKELHSIFSRFRIRGEWFEKRGAVVAFISSLPKYEPAPRIIRDRPEVHSNGSTLAAFIIRAGLNEAQFARSIGVTQQAVNSWTRGIRSPRMNQMMAIIAATDGAVTPNDFMPPSAESSSRTCEAAE